MRKRRKSLKIFNFSFIDILATTIGVLLFIMLMAILKLSGAVTVSEQAKNAKVAKQKRDGLEKNIAQTREALEKLKKENKKKEEDIKVQDIGNWDLNSKIYMLGSVNNALEEKKRGFENKKDEIKAKLEKLEEVIRKYRREIVEGTGSRGMLPVASNGAKGIPVHVDCRSDGLIILGADLSDKSSRQHCPLDKISIAGSVFDKLLSRVSARKKQSDKSREIIVLWVRPDGLDAFKKAVFAARKAGAPLGWEPANTDWNF